MEGSAPSRFILADINQSAAGWDDFCNAEDTEALYEWLKTVNDQQPVPRFVDIVTNLNIFADASQLAFCVDIRGSCLPYTRLCGRYGLFPPAQRTNHTIVQKELCSLHLAVQLLAEIDVVFREHGPRPLSYTVYTDSEINLHRLRQDPARDDKLGRYERRRLRLIRSQSALLAASGVSVVIRHVGGDCNPSDVCTRRPPRGTVLRPTDPDIIHKGVLLSSDTFVFKAAPQEKCDTPLEVNLVDSIDFGVSLDTLRQAQEACGRVCAIRQRISDGEDKYHKVNDDGLVVRVTALEIPDDADTHTDVLPQILVPDAALQVPLAKAAHEFSHRGRRGTLKLLRKTYFWRKMRTTVKHVCDDCRPCQLSKFDRIAKCSLGSTMPWIGGLGPGRVCSIDFTGPYGCRDRDGHLSQDRHNFGITVTDLMTGYTRGATTPTKCSADATHALQIMFDSSDWVSVLIASDQTFRSADFRYWCQVHKISLVLLPSYSPSLMGHAERTHKDIHNYMRTVAQQSGGLEDWTTTFHRAIRVVNTCPYADSDNDGGLSPHDMHYISKARIPEIEPVDLRLGDKLYPGLDSSPPIVPTDVYEDVNAIRKQRWAQFKVGWLDRREKTRLETLRRPALPSLSPGDHVYIWQPMTRKLLWRWRGPYIVRGIDHSIVTITGRRGMEERVHLGNCRKVEAGEVEEGVTESPVDDDLLDEVDVPDQLSGAEDEPDISAESWPFGDVPNPVISPMPAEPGPTLTASPSPDPALDAKCRQVRSRIGLDVAVVEYDDDGGYKLEFGRFEFMI
ncbi:hypothetical protein Pmar_PMAR015906 [Perkinsus marinus ATCC 50983]|uniref:Integrase catalytic domain-containing protein n=1 Tax=Perkinsus marinus (strain ATCC 50983 / TXsc) TaxID=423536 RepID=C5LTJ1_PERM5|nr:hypothetical protein Pmar_PMAR015906 [Perkinsus marinus ATCC 50983]EEQ99954.1 hypothetical protein Pmar_PMAR015906 [Perkinsus marinus ATCC 50983]|eukprot:XP_002767237.1 hypothetical protein Pmar_PMAR015906 [Perkinsus marinus ATCC 50983]